MEAAYRNTGVEFHLPQYRFTQPCKTALIGLGIILLIGSALASGPLYSRFGYASLSCLVGVSLGIVLVVLGIRYTKAPDPQQEIIRTLEEVDEGSEETSGRPNEQDRIERSSSPTIDNSTENEISLVSREENQSEETDDEKCETVTVDERVAENSEAEKKQNADKRESSEREKEPVTEKCGVEKAYSYEYKSYKDSEARSPYHINNDAPVTLNLKGPRSHYQLNAIQNPELKEVLLKVGSEFERAQKDKFSISHHVFTRTVSGKGSGVHANFVKNIFAFVNTAIHDQTKGELILDLADMTELYIINEEEEDSFIQKRAYTLDIKISEKAVDAAEKSGLVFRDYGFIFFSRKTP